MKTFKIESTGELQTNVQSIVDTYNGREVTKEQIAMLDDDIRFVVCDLRVAHGNLNKHSKDAWLCPTNGDNSFNVRINF